MTSKTQPNFEESMKRLELIVSNLEKGDLTLEKSIEAFEEGTKLVETCNKSLKTAEMRVEKLMKKGSEA